MESRSASAWRAGISTRPSRRALRDKVFVDAGKAKGTGLADGAEARPRSKASTSPTGTRSGSAARSRPIRSDPDDVYDWVDFVLNVGKANTAGHDGRDVRLR